MWLSFVQLNEDLFDVHNDPVYLIRFYVLCMLVCISSQVVYKFLELPLYIIPMNEQTVYLSQHTAFGRSGAVLHQEPALMVIKMSANKTRFLHYHIAQCTLYGLGSLPLDDWHPVYIFAHFHCCSNLMYDRHRVRVHCATPSSSFWHINMYIKHKKWAQQ